MKKRTFPALLSLLSALVLLLSSCIVDPPPHTHTFAEAWTHNENEHWHAATCEDTDEVSGRAPHNFVNGTCSVCGFPDPNPGTVDPPPPTSPIILTSVEKMNYLQTYYGVGRTLNVITDRYINVTAGYRKIFDPDRLLALNWYRSTVGRMTSQSVTEKSMTEYFGSLNENCKVSLGGSLNVGVFSAGAQAEFGFSTGESYRHVANEIFHTTSQVYAANLVAIDEYYDIEQFADILSDRVLDSAAKVQSGEMSPDEFVRLYGTHAVLAGFYGGSVECAYYLCNKGEKWDENTALDFESKVGTGMKNLFDVNVGTGFSVKNEGGSNTEKTEERFSASALGGANFNALSMEDFLAHYGEWVDSINAQAEYGNLVALPANSLVAVWDMFPAEYDAARMILAEWFAREAKNVSDSFLLQYVREESSPVDPPSVKEPPAGYKAVCTADDFRNIQYAPDADYFLMNNIDLGVWNNPFAFSGRLDGDGHKITYSQITDTTTNCCGGLFTVLDGAEIRNLYLDAMLTGTGSNTVKVGALAGSTRGAVRLSRICAGGSVRYLDGNGADSIGGLLGECFGGTIDQCACSLELKSSAFEAVVGGIIGFAQATEADLSVTNCRNTGDLYAGTGYIWGHRASGGIIGRVKGSANHTLVIRDCLNDSRVECKQEKNAALGWWGCGGLLGDIADGDSTGVAVFRSYWNNTPGKVDLTGNNTSFHENNGKSDLRGDIPDWSRDIWSFHPGALPTLRWMEEE